MSNLFKSLVFIFLVSLTSTASAQQYGSFTDNRDGHTYRTLKIGGQIWMAENMAIKLGDSYPPGGDYDNIPVYGRLYTWSAAQVVCPFGWHLPTKKEFERLLINLCGQDSCSASSLKKTGFGALPAGYYGSGSYYDFGSRALFWSSTEDNSSSAYRLYVGSSRAFMDNLSKSHGYSVRCLKDSN